MNNDESKLFEKLEDEILKRFYAEVEKLAERIGLILERETKDVLTANNKIATGELRKSIRYKVTKLVSAYLVTCFANVNYSQYVYDGTRPHFPPIEQIIRWVRRKGIAGKYSIKTHKRLGNMVQQNDEDRQLALMIARSIAKKGTKGIKFFDIALKQAWPVIEKEIQSFKF